jgi:hypothetical protein
VSGIGTRHVARVRLRLYVEESSAQGGEIRLAANDWTESSVGWTTAPAMLSPIVQTLGSVQFGTYVTFDVTSLVQRDGTYSFSVASASPDRVGYASRETGTPPQLLIESSA